MLQRQWEISTKNELSSHDERVTKILKLAKKFHVAYDGKEFCVAPYKITTSWEESSICDINEKNFDQFAYALQAIDYIWKVQRKIFNDNDIKELFKNFDPFGLEIFLRVIDTHNRHPDIESSEDGIYELQHAQDFPEIYDSTGFDYVMIWRVNSFAQDDDTKKHFKKLITSNPDLFITIYKELDSTSSKDSRTMLKALDPDIKFDEQIEMLKAPQTKEQSDSYSEEESTSEDSEDDSSSIRTLRGKDEARDEESDEGINSDFEDYYARNIGIFNNNNNNNKQYISSNSNSKNVYNNKLIDYCNKLTDVAPYVVFTLVTDAIRAGNKELAYSTVMDYKKNPEIFEKIFESASILRYVPPPVLNFFLTCEDLTNTEFESLKAELAGDIQDIW